MVIKNEIHRDKDTIMFDIDFTLVYFDTLDKLSRQALNEYGYFGREYEIAHQNGIKNLLEKSRVNKNYFSLENYIIEQQESMGLKEEDTPYVVKRMLELTPQYTRVYDGVKDTLETLDQDLICVSDWFAKTQLNKLEAVGIEHYFRMLYTCEGQYAKPNQERFLHILKEECFNAKHCLMVGDSSTDLGALSVGVDTVIVDYNNDRHNLHERATAVITEFSDLQKILRR